MLKLIITGDKQGSVWGKSRPKMLGGVKEGLRYVYHIYAHVMYAPTLKKYYHNRKRRE